MAVEFFIARILTAKQKKTQLVHKFKNATCTDVLEIGWPWSKIAFWNGGLVNRSKVGTKGWKRQHVIATISAAGKKLKIDDVESEPLK